MKNILLLGLGAIGSLVASKFADNNTDIDILVDNDRYERYEKESIYINKKEYKFNYVTNDNYNEKADFVIIATKYKCSAVCSKSTGGDYIRRLRNNEPF